MLWDHQFRHDARNMSPDLCFGGKLKDNHDQPKRSKAPFVVCLLVFQVLVVTVLLPGWLRLTQSSFANLCASLPS